MSQNRRTSDLPLKPPFLESFDEIYHGNYGKLMRIAVKMTGDRDGAADIVQDVFESYYIKRNGGHVILYPPGWLCKAVLNRCADSVKKRRMFEKIETSRVDDAADRTEEPERRIAAVNAALARLSPREKALAVLYSEGLSYKEISESTGIRFSSVGKTLARTLGKLGNELKNQRYELY
jgi:RNA polymerase sigma-70 factor, ECF subfamily